jgi:hypothetical protein
MTDLPTLTPALLLGLYFIHRYRFLTITQFAAAAGLSRGWSETMWRPHIRRECIDAETWPTFTQHCHR